MRYRPADWSSPDGPQRKDSWNLIKRFLIGAAMMVAAAGLAHVPFQIAQHEVVSVQAEQSAGVLPDCWRVGSAQ
jgi:hypothetical protein